MAHNVQPALPVITVWADPVGCTIDKNSSDTIMSIRTTQQLYSCKLACYFQPALHVIPVWADPVGCTIDKNYVYTNMILYTTCLLILLCMLFLSGQTLWAAR